MGTFQPPRPTPTCLSRLTLKLTEIARPPSLLHSKSFSDPRCRLQDSCSRSRTPRRGQTCSAASSPAHIEAIGFEMYTTMLEEAVNKMKGEGGQARARQPRSSTSGSRSRIDSDYIPRRKTSVCRMYKTQSQEPWIKPSIDDVPQRTARPLWRSSRVSPEPALSGRVCACNAKRPRHRATRSQAHPRLSLPNPNGNKKQPPQNFRGDAAHPICHTRRRRKQPGPRADRSGDADESSSLANAKRGRTVSRQQGVFRWPLTSAKSEDVLAETRELLESLTPNS